MQNKCSKMKRKKESGIEVTIWWTMLPRRKKKTKNIPNETQTRASCPALASGIVLSDTLYVVSSGI